MFMNRNKEEDWKTNVSDESGSVVEETEELGAMMTMAKGWMCGRVV